MPDHSRTQGPHLSNAEIANQLNSLAQLLTVQKENPYKARAYRTAATQIEMLSESVEELVHRGADLTAYSGIGKTIAAAIQEIVSSGSSRQLEDLRSQVRPEIAAISEYPRLDPARVLRIYKKLNIGSIDQLKTSLASGEILRQLGARMEQHVRQAVTETHEMLLYDAGPVVESITEFLLSTCPVTKAQATGEYRRRAETISEVSFLIQTSNFADVVAQMERFGGRTRLLSSENNRARFQLSSGIFLSLETADSHKWGLALLVSTGSEAHVRQLDKRGPGLLKLASSKTKFPDESKVYEKLGLRAIPPELREGLDEIDLAQHDALPVLIAATDIKGELHAHSTSSDGAHSIEQMSAAAKAKGYEYVGITDHSQSLKIARGLSEEELWNQIRHIDTLNAKARGIRILKSAEVDILENGLLDYPDILLKELDYTVCSIHSKFALDKTRQTERILRAMDNRYFTILGHATGRLLLKRPGYQIDVERVLQHALRNSCFVEINSSPDRLDLSATNARLAREAGVKVAITTDAHATAEFEFVACGIDQARRAGLERESVLNSRSWKELQPLLKR